MSDDDAQGLVDDDRALAASGVGLWSWDILADKVSWSDALRALAGTSASTASDFLACVAEEDRPRVQAAIERALAGAPFDDVEHRLVRPDGQLRWVMCRGRVERDAGGRAIGLHGACVDITERRLRHERHVAAQRLESVGRLAGGIAHDFNNMLTVILGSAHLAEAKLQEPMPDLEDVRADLLDMRRAAERAALLTAKLLAFAGKQAHHPRSFRLDTLLVDVERQLRPLLGGNVELAITPGARARVHADPQQIEQVVSNLVLNARDAMPHGGRITLSTHDLAHPEGARVRLVVSDNGHGIAPEHVGRVFEPFFTTKPIGLAAGLGLATCYGLVEQNRGTIAFETKVGHGTTFRVDLPASARAVTEPRVSVVAPGPTRSGPRSILVVEDDELVRLMSVRMLERQGFQVHAAASGHVALDILGTTPVDMVVSDLVMPQMSGQELAAVVRQVWPGMKILFVSGYSEDAVDGIELLSKPFTAAALVERVQRMLGT